MSASGFKLLTRCLPRVSNGLANTTATLGSFYWLGFETSGLSPDKKRLAWLGAQRKAHPPLGARAEVYYGVEVVVTRNHRNRTAPSGWMVRLVGYSVDCLRNVFMSSVSLALVEG